MSGRDLIVDKGVDANGVHERIIVGDHRIRMESVQNDAVCNRIMDSVHEIARDGARKSDFMKPAARIPIALWQKWRNEFMGKNPGQRLGSAPKAHMTWRQFLALKLSSREYSRLRMVNNL